MGQVASVAVVVVGVGVVGGFDEDLVGGNRVGNVWDYNHSFICNISIPENPLDCNAGRWVLEVFSWLVDSRKHNAALSIDQARGPGGRGGTQFVLMLHYLPSLQWG